MISNLVTAEEKYYEIMFNNRNYVFIIVGVSKLRSSYGCVIDENGKEYIRDQDV